MAVSIPQTPCRSTMPGQRYSRLLHLDLLGMPLLVVQLGLQPDHLLGLPGALVSLAPFLLPLSLMVVQPVAVPLAVQLDVLVLRLWAQDSAFSASRHWDETGEHPIRTGQRGRLRPRPRPRPRPPSSVPRPPSPVPRPPVPVPVPVPVPRPPAPPWRRPHVPLTPRRSPLRSEKGRPFFRPSRVETRPAALWFRLEDGRHPALPKGLRPGSVGQERGETNRKGRSGCSPACVYQPAVGVRKAGPWGNAMRSAPSGATRRLLGRLGAVVQCDGHRGAPCGALAM